MPHGAQNGFSTEIRPPRLASRTMRALCCVVDVDAPSEAQQATCRFLLALYLMDVIGWVCYKICLLYTSPSPRDS